MQTPSKELRRATIEAQTNAQPPTVDLTWKRRRSRRFWFFRIAALVFPLISIAIIEISLRLTGHGIDPALVQKSLRADSQNAHFLNPQVDVAYSQVDLRGPEPRGFELPRPADLFRVIVVGESSVQGYPYPSDLSFPRQMEFILQRQMPEKRVEVLNAGIIGLSSLPLTDLIQQCLSAEPSLIVLYAGHNEFYGVGGVATNARLAPVSITLRKTRLMQWLTDGNARTNDRTVHTQNPLIRRLPKEFQIPQASPLVRRAHANFQSRMKSAAEFCVRQKIPLLICSPVSNLRSQSPFAAGELNVFAEIERRIGTPMSFETSELYLTELKKAADIDRDNAVIQFRMAQCLEMAGQYDDAFRAYVAARDLDQCRYRAPSTFGQGLDEMARHFPAGVWYLDLEPAFREHSKNQVPGDELFLEHVHFTIDGHWLMAKAIGRQIIEQTCKSSWDPMQVPAESERDQWLGLIDEDRLVGLYLASFIGEVAPFDEALDAKMHVADLKAKIEALENSFSAEQLRRFHSLPNPVKVDDLIDGLGRIQLDRNDPHQALEYFERSTRRRPWMPNGYVFSACAYQMSGDVGRACEMLQKSKSTVMPETPRLKNDRLRLESRIQRSKSAHEG
jgi:lysophospholipase L1-like esterase